jgi:uncharacterized protein
MLSLSYPGLAFYALVLIGAFAVRSAAGFGAVLVAVPMLAFILPMTTAVPVASALAVVTAIRYVGRDWRHIAWRQFVIISLYTIIGIAIGFCFLRVLDEHTLRRGLAVFLIIYSVYVLMTGGLPPAVSARWHGVLAGCAGILGGFFGALFGGGVGPIYVIYFNVLRLDRETFRATMTTVMLVSAAARIVGYASFGFYGGPTLMLLAFGLPLIAIGSWLGDRLAHILNPRRFSFLIGGLVLMSGVALLFK